MTANILRLTTVYTIHYTTAASRGVPKFQHFSPPHRCLQVLVLTQNRFGEQGTTTLLHSLQHNSSLTTLTLDTPTMGGAKVNTLELLLAKNMQLSQYQKQITELRHKNKQLTKKLEQYEHTIK